MSKKICIITNGYPTKNDPVYAFIKPLVEIFADQGNECTVIAPQSITRNLLRKSQKRPYKWQDYSEKGNLINIIQPSFFSFSSLKLFGHNLSVYFRDISINSCYKREKVDANILYAHFWDCGIAASKIAEKNKLPLYVASGESKIRVFEYYKEKDVFSKLAKVNGVICVSTKNLNESKELGLLINNPKLIVEPNAVDPSKFYIKSKQAARNELGISIDEKVAIFVGSFTQRKGVLRVVNSVESNPTVKLVLIGKGELEPLSESILFSGIVDHNKICTYLNAADVFILPTLAEGCCNAIIEALACGLPVISSNLPFNYDILNNNNSILINPRSVEEISDAIQRVFEDDKYRVDLSKGAALTASRLTIESRGLRILRFMDIE